MNNPNGFRWANETATLRVSRCLQLIIFALLTAVQGVLLTVAATPHWQTPPGAARPPAKKKYTLRITKEDIIGVSLKANKAKLSEIGVDLSKRLGVKVILGPAMEKEAISVEFADLTIEPALRLLAPHVYLDYEIRAGAQPTLLGIFLFGAGDPDPAPNAVVEAGSQAMLIEGNTEDTGQATADDPLQVDLDDDDHLTIKSRKQPLAAVVMTIADVLGVPAEIKYESDEIVDTELKDMLAEDAIPRLSPNVRLYVRADLTRLQRTPLRLSIVPPAVKVASQ
jgi:hypothetical protein